MELLILVIIFFFGAAIGSFINVVSQRLPENKSLNGRSHCPNCGRQLRWWELIPLLSFIFLRKRCSECQQKIAWQYFLVEIITALLFVWSWVYLKPVSLAEYLLLIKYCLASAVLIIIFLIDLQYYLILDKVIFSLLAVFTAVNLGLDFVSHNVILSFSGFAVSGLLAGLAAAVPFFCLWYFSGGRFMGFGDVKLALLLGAILLWPQIWVCLYLAVLLGGAVSLLLLLATKMNLKSKLPFGTFLSLGAVICLFYGEKFLHWY